MRQLATTPSSLVRQIANSFGSIGDIDSWLRTHSVYRGENEEVIRTPDFMLTELLNTGIMEGDCDCFATLCGSICYALGIPCRFAAVRTESENPCYTHVFTEAGIRGAWFRIDPTVSADIVIPEFDRLEQAL